MSVEVTQIAIPIDANGLDIERGACTQCNSCLGYLSVCTGSPLSCLLTYIDQDGPYDCSCGHPWHSHAAAPSEAGDMIPRYRRGRNYGSKCASYYPVCRYSSIPFHSLTGDLDYVTAQAQYSLLLRKPSDDPRTPHHSTLCYSVSVDPATSYPITHFTSNHTVYVPSNHSSEHPGYCQQVSERCEVRQWQQSSELQLVSNIPCSASAGQRRIAEALDLREGVPVTARSLAPQPSLAGQPATTTVTGPRIGYPSAPTTQIVGGPALARNVAGTSANSPQGFILAVIPVMVSTLESH